MKLILTNFKRRGQLLSKGEEQALLQKIIDLLYAEGLEFDLKLEDIDSAE